MISICTVGRKNKLQIFFLFFNRGCWRFSRRKSKLPVIKPKCFMLKWNLPYFLHIASCHPTRHHWEESTCVFIPPHQVFIQTNEIPLSFLFPDCTVSNISLSPCKTDAPFFRCSLIILVSSVDSPHYVHISYKLGNPRLESAPQVGFTALGLPGFCLQGGTGEPPSGESPEDAPCHGHFSGI